MLSRILRVALPVLVLAVGIAGMDALLSDKPVREVIGAEERSWPVATAAVEPGTATPQLILFALVGSPRVTQLSSAVTSRVETVDVLEGQRVGPEDRLLALGDREVRLTLAQREAELAGFEADLDHEMLRHRNNLAALEHEKKLLALARREAARAQVLVRRNAGSEASLDKARREEQRQLLVIEQRKLAVREHQSRKKQIEAKLARARAQRLQAMLDVERTRVYPPFGGRITEVLVSPGDRVRPGDRLLVMFDTEMLELRAQIPLRYLPLLRAVLERGQTLDARAVVDGRAVRASLHRLTAQVDRGSGGVNGLFRVTEGNAWLQIGRTVELVLDLPPVHGVITVPRTALYGTDRVYVFRGERMKSVRVERLGETRPAGGPSRLLLRSPHLGPSDRIIVTQLPNAIDGLKVQEVAP